MPRKRGRPQTHGGDRLALQIHGQYRDSVEELRERLSIKFAEGAFRYRSDAVQWAIDRALDDLRAEQGRIT